MLMFRDVVYLQHGMGKVMLTNLNENITEVEVSQMFSQFGPVVICKLNRMKRPQRSTIKYGKVQFRTREEALAAAAVCVFSFCFQRELRDDLVVCACAAYERDDSVGKTDGL